MFIDTNELLDWFLALPVESKRVKIDHIVALLKEKYAFYDEISSFFVEYDKQISESILDYVYTVTMQCVESNQYEKILEAEKQQLPVLKKQILSA